MNNKILTLPQIMTVNIRLYEPPNLESSTGHTTILMFINPFECFFGIEGNVALDRNLRPGYNTLHLRLIPGDLYSVCSHRQSHTLPILLGI